jgi:hypothetical protein
VTVSARQTRRPGREALPTTLDRRFEAVVFDWDGTAVPDRQADATQLRNLVEEVCTLGLEVAVVTGTHVDNVDGQLGARPKGPGRAPVVQAVLERAHLPVLLIPVLPVERRESFTRLQSSRV